MVYSQVANWLMLLSTAAYGDPAAKGKSAVFAAYHLDWGFIYE